MTDLQREATLNWAKRAGILKDLAVDLKEGEDYEVLV